MVRTLLHPVQLVGAVNLKIEDLEGLDLPRDPRPHYTELLAFREEKRGEDRVKGREKDLVLTDVGVGVQDLIQAQDDLIKITHPMSILPERRGSK